MSDTTLTKDDIRAVLNDVIDPEVGISVVELGFIYEVNAEEDGYSFFTRHSWNQGCCLLRIVSIQEFFCQKSIPGVTETASKQYNC